MDQHTYSNTSSSSDSSYQYPKKPTKSSRPSYLKSLHSVHKPMNKHFIAPLPPTPPKVYDVDARNFKEVVRMLTSTPQFQYRSTRQLKDIAPPSLALTSIPKTSLFAKLTPPLEEGGELSTFMLSPNFCNLLNETLDTTSFGHGELGYDLSGGTPFSPLEFCLSPNSLSWCSSALLNP